MTRPIRAALVASAIFALMSNAAFAQAASAPDTQAAPAFKAADDTMMRHMQMTPTGNTDQEFVAGMIPHHQGAVAMAKIELQYGKDPAMRRLAHNIVKSQDSQVALMKAWQAKHPAS